ncbi:MAG: hypothetical protein HYV20_07655 [Gemmatimonadetes bacterium]|nr:hypothetical protein [Gemmatimonadota bacterium]
MRRPSILDVVRAVTVVAPRHPQVITWWYRPVSPFRLQGEPGTPAEPAPAVEVVVMLRDGRATNWDAVASELSGHLAGAAVRVRAHRGAEAEGHLVRVLSAPSGAS